MRRKPNFLKNKKEVSWTRRMGKWKGSRGTEGSRRERRGRHREQRAGHGGRGRRRRRRRRGGVEVSTRGWGMDGVHATLPQLPTQNAAMLCCSHLCRPQGPGRSIHPSRHLELIRRHAHLTQLHQLDEFRLFHYSQLSTPDCPIALSVSQSGRAPEAGTRPTNEPWLPAWPLHDFSSCIGPTISPAAASLWVVRCVLLLVQLFARF